MSLKDEVARVNEIEKSVAVEIYKLILANSFDYIRNLSQSQQTLTSLLITAYVALLVGFRKEIGFDQPMILFLALLPLVLWFAALVSVFLINRSYTGQNLIIREIEVAINQYSSIIANRRNQLTFPAVLTGVGVLAFILTFQTVFLSAAQSSNVGSTAITQATAAAAKSTAAAAQATMAATKAIAAANQATTVAAQTKKALSGIGKTPSTP